MKKIFYAIDMGAPSGKYSGFYCWRYDPETNKLDAFEKSTGWYGSITRLVDDSKDREVHLTIEAALWGMKDPSSGEWKRRFHLVKKNDWSERPWYTGAGASTGLMAQLYLNQVIESGAKKIIVRESYISGLSLEGCSLTVPKPVNPIIGINTKHSNDAFEGLLLTLEDQLRPSEFQKLKFEFNTKGLDITRWSTLQRTMFHEIQIRGGNMFALGVLSNSKFFDFKLGKILFTKRDFGKFPTR